MYGNEHRVSNLKEIRKDLDEKNLKNEIENNNKENLQKNNKSES